LFNNERELETRLAYKFLLVIHDFLLNLILPAGLLLHFSWLSAHSAEASSQLPIALL